jgi:hypothetical protein
MPEAGAGPTSDTGSKRERERDRIALRDLVRDLLLHDPDLHALLKEHRPDAAMGTWVQGLIEGKLKQHIRPEALRRPL